MRPVTIRPHWAAAKGQVMVMADASHPEVPMFQPIDEAGRLLLICHADDEQRLRDVVAIAQERPAWWETLAQFERLCKWGLGLPQDVDVIGAAEGIEDWLDEQTG